MERRPFRRVAPEWFGSCSAQHEMKFDENDSADASQVEDRRGAGFSGGRLGAGVGGLGLVGTLIFLAFNLFTGGNATLGGAEPTPSPASGTNAPLTGSCKGVSSGSEPAKFIACVE